MIVIYENSGKKGNKIIANKNICYIYVLGDERHDVCVEVRGQPRGGGSPLPSLEVEPKVSGLAATTFTC